MFIRNSWLLVCFVRFLDVVVPRFIQEEVAFYEVGQDGEDILYAPLCAMRDLTEADVDATVVGTMRSFNLFGMALWPKLVSTLEPIEPESELEG